MKQLEKLQIKINQLELDLAKASTLPVSKPLLENLPAATPTNEGITAFQVLVTVSFILFTGVVIYWLFFPQVLLVRVL